MNATRLCEETLGQLPSHIVRPTYERQRSSVGIVHLGPGNFHRSHQAFYLDELRQRGDVEWGMRGAGIMPYDAPRLEALAEQDCLYTLQQKAPDGSVTYRVIGSICQVNTPGNHDQVVDWLCEDSVRVVTLTVTEGGYFRDPQTKTFSAPAALLEQEWNSSRPETVFGYLVRALERRRDSGTDAFTVLSCDNLLGTRQALLCFAAAKDASLAEWIDQHVATPSCMVDCITPMATDADTEAVRDALGVEDRAVVTCETFRQWVIEDDFPTGRPAWERVGVQFVDDVAPYEHIKLRMLNAGHQVACYLGALAGFTYMHEVCSDPTFGALLDRFWRTEAMPVCPSPAGFDLDEYRAALTQRFQNPGVRDTLARIAVDTSDRIPGFLLPTVVDNLAAGGAVEVSALVVAAWARYLRGSDDQGRPLPVVDSRADELRALVAKDPLGLLDHPQLSDVAGSQRFRAAVAAAHEELAQHGARAAAQRVVYQGAA